MSKLYLRILLMNLLQFDSTVVQGPDKVQSFICDIRVRILGKNDILDNKNPHNRETIIVNLQRQFIICNNYM